MSLAGAFHVYPKSFLELLDLGDLGAGEDRVIPPSDAPLERTHEVSVRARHDAVEQFHDGHR